MRTDVVNAVAPSGSPEKSPAMSFATALFSSLSVSLTVGPRSSVADARRWEPGGATPLLGCARARVMGRRV